MSRKNKTVDFEQIYWAIYMTFSSQSTDKVYIRMVCRSPRLAQRSVVRDASLFIKSAEVCVGLTISSKTAINMDGCDNPS